MVEINIEQKQNPQNDYSNRTLLILPNGEENFYESEGPMSPLSNYYESIQRIFGDDDVEDVDGIIASFNNIYMQQKIQCPSDGFHIHIRLN